MDLSQPDEQLAHLADLNAFMANPWFEHFSTLFANEAESLKNLIFYSRVLDVPAGILREQSIGEYRGLLRFSVDVKETHQQIVAYARDRDTPTDNAAGA